MIDGSTAGTGADHYSQTQVAGSIILNNPTLNVTLGPDFSPIDRDIVHHRRQDSGSSAVSGTFNGLAQGSTIEVDGTTFAISYDGGTNSDSIVLTELYPSTTSFPPIRPLRFTGNRRLHGDRERAERHGSHRHGRLL